MIQFDLRMGVWNGLKLNHQLVLNRSKLRHGPLFYVKFEMNYAPGDGYISPLTGKGKSSTRKSAGWDGICDGFQEGTPIESYKRDDK